MLDFYQLTPDEFECLCYEYICCLYSTNQNYQINHTRYVHDGGRDIEITFYDQLSHFKIWAECKQHKRNIGLDDIGKNVVLVISKHIQKVIFFSASEITESAKIEIANIGDKLNFNVSFLCGERLAKEIRSQPNLLKNFFKNIKITSALSCEEKITVTCSVSEFESNVIIPINKQEQVYLRNGELFNIYIHLSNQTNKSIQEISLELLSIDNRIKIENAQIKYEFLERQGDVIAHFKGRIIIRQSDKIDLPKVLICYSFDNIHKKEIISLPSLNISKCKKYPFIGKSVTNFLVNKVDKALEWSDRNYSQIFDIRGISGSGKSRLASEIQKKAIEHDLCSICLNGSDYIDYDIIRKLLCELLHLPFYKGQINFTKKDVSELVKIHGGSNTFSNIIAEFMQTGVWKKNDSIYIVEALAFFLQNPYNETGYCISIDNTQTLHPEVLKVLIRLTELLVRNQNRTILIFISNTERQIVSHKAFNSFLSYFDEKNRGHHSEIISYICSAFEEEDAKLLLMHLLGFKNQNDILLKKLLQITGRLPFELTMTLEYLSDKKIIKWNNAKEWIINDYELFDKFILKGFPENHAILEDRMKAWKETHSKSINIKFIDILSTVVAFDGLVPYAYITDNKLDYELIDQMITMLWLTPSISERGITFFHDNIKEFCNTLPRCKNNANVLRKIKKWLDNNSNIDVLHFEKIKFFCYYYLGEFNNALEYGEKILNDSSVLSHADIVEISRILYEDSRIKSNPRTFIRIAEIYANAVFSLDNKELGCNIYQVIVDYIKNNKTAIDFMESCRILHHAINSQLQSARYTTAIEWIGILEHIPNLPTKYQFIVENRYGVAYIALGQFKKAKKSLTNSLTIASETMKNLYWTSTAHSDIALYYFYNWKKFGRDEASSLITGEFELAINDYTLYENHDVSRDIEMAWHKTFIKILNGRYDAAIKEANECICLSRRNNHSYELSRGYNLKALAQLFNGCDQDAQDSLEEGLNACTLYGFPSGIFRIYNNLGVIYYVKKNYIKAHYYFDLALNTLDKQIEYKQYPILTNLLLISINLKDDKLTNNIERRIESIGSNELFEYCKSMYIHRAELKKFDSFTFWGFNGSSYIF